MPSPELEPGTRGFIIPIGGAEDKMQDMAILSRFFDLSGGKKSKIAIIPTASSLQDTGDRYKKIFQDMGGEAVVLFIRDREDAGRCIRVQMSSNLLGGVFLGTI